MSDDLHEAETAAVPVPQKKLSIATILGLLLLFAAVVFGIYVGSIWQGHISRTSRLKAKNGDFVQKERQGDIDEFEPAARGGGRSGDGGSTAEKDAASETPKGPNWYDQYVAELFPKPVQIVYWRDPSLTAEDVEMLLQFKDLEILSLNCNEVDSAAIQKFLTLPKLRRLNVLAGKLDVSGIADWKADKKFKNLSLVNPNWKGSDIEDVRKQAEGNQTLKDKIGAASSARPSFGGT